MPIQDQQPENVHSRRQAEPTAEGRMARSRRIMQQFLRFGIVGASGFLVNQAVFVIVRKLLDLGWAVGPEDAMLSITGTQWNIRWYHTLSVVAFVVANVWNFLLNRCWTFKDLEKQAWWVQLPRFMAVGVFGLLITLVISTGLVHQSSPIALPEDIFDNSTGLRTRAYWGNFIGVIGAVPANFLFNRLWTFRSKKPKESKAREVND